MNAHNFHRLAAVAAVALSAAWVRAEGPAGGPVFEKDVLPIFEAHCLKCHGGKKQMAKLDLRSKAAMLRGGEGGPAMKPGASAGSMLWDLISKDKMPPGKVKLTADERSIIRLWIDGGAKDSGLLPAQPPTAGSPLVSEEDRNFWSFQPPVRPEIPAVAGKARVRTPVDAFILASLEKKGLSLSPEADRATLLRRVFADLVGVPPSPKEIEQFLNDGAADAYERLIDRLLADARYGERWGRHWLDAAGYADSEGILDADHVRAAAWRYRDYVVRAFNSDKPYDRFLKEQLAGDELVDYHAAYRTEAELSPEVAEAITATGFLRCASDTSRPDFVNIKNAPGYYFQTLDDTVKIVASATMGLTLQCAKCHSHKYDPIPQSDYYRIQAVFMSGYRPAQWVPQVERRLFLSTLAQKKEADAHNAKLDAEIAKLKKRTAELQKPFAEKLLVDRLAKLPAQIRDDVKAALAAEPAKRTEVQKYLADKFAKELKPDAAALAKALVETYPEYKTKSGEIDAAIKAEDAKRKTFPEIRAFYDLPGEPKTALLRRGNYLDPGPEVQPGTLAVLSDAPQPYTWTAPAKDAPTSKRRLAFAEWLTQPGHPLTARVMVNRIWMHHFGEGLVPTPDNFGRTGSAPSHRELLDWLATEFPAPTYLPLTKGEAGRGWSVKQMHRLIMTSSVYRQTSKVPEAGAAAANPQSVDPTNRLLWRQRLRRLEAEALRDSVLSVAGTLNPEMFGPPVAIQRRGDGEVVTADDPAGRRRSLYLQVRRSQPLTMLQVFDQPVIETNCTHRSVSTVSSQALTLLNSDFMVRQAEALADRAIREGGADPAGLAVTLAFTRSATAEEKSKLAAFVEAQSARHAVKGLKPDAARRAALADVCHMLLSANEFAYVD